MAIVAYQESEIQGSLTHQIEANLRQTVLDPDFPPLQTADNSALHSAVFRGLIN